jgi:DNA-directed RNA polymerase subunit RPC12/RpoP
MEDREWVRTLGNLDEILPIQGRRVRLREAWDLACQYNLEFMKYILFKDLVKSVRNGSAWSLLPQLYTPIGFHWAGIGRIHLIPDITENKIQVSGYRPFYASEDDLSAISFCGRNVYYRRDSPVSRPRILCTTCSEKIFKKRNKKKES